MIAKYVVITPARNEVAFIGLTAESFIAQSVRPLKWVVVSDGSTDGTDELIKEYAERHPWITLLRMPERKERDFAGKVRAFNAGRATLTGIDYEAIGSLDADISFDPDYFRFLLAKLTENPLLGLVGTPFAEDGVTYDYRFASLEHVSGACQLFRRECFDAIGGYVPVKSGGIDLVAVLSARMHGWQTRTFPEKVCHHHRKQGSATRSGLGVIVNDGRKDYLLGSHPLWEVFRAGYRMFRRPYFIGGAALFAGYLGPALLSREKTAPADIVAFRRRDQMTRLRAIILRRWSAAPAVQPQPMPQKASK